MDGSSLRSTAFNLKEGQSSGYIPGRDGGYVAFVEKFIPAGDEDVKAGLASFLEELRRRHATEAFSDWMNKQMQSAKLTLAGDNEMAATQ